MMIILFDECITDSFLNEVSKKYNILYINILKYKYNIRKYNESEINKILEKYYSNCQMPDIIKSKYETYDKCELILEYPNNLYNKLLEENDKYDFIFLDFDYGFLNIKENPFIENKLKLNIVLPKENCLVEWVGRYYISHRKNNISINNILYNKYNKIQKIIDKYHDICNVKYLDFGEYLTLDDLENNFR